MKICFYNLTAGFKTGGLETYCWEAGRALARQGHEVHIIGGEGGKPRHDEVKLISFPYTPRSRFPNLGTRFRKFCERLSFARHAAAELKNGNYDAVIVNKPYDFPALWWLKRQGFSGVTALRSGGTEFYAGDRFFARAVDVWLSTSAYNAAQVEGRYGHPVDIVHNGVDPEIFKPGTIDSRIREQFSIPVEASLIVSTGRLIGWKGLRIIIETLPGIPNTHYLIIGDGPEREKLEQLCAQLVVSDRVHFAGEVAHRDLPDHLRTGNVFVQPSIGEEAFGISVVEAMACGLPVLASDQGGLREIVIGGETGELLPGGDFPRWAKVLKDLLANSERCKTLGVAGRQRVLEKFTWDGNARRLGSALTQTP
ncbi:glycosyltransferase family 4 protein [Propionivibrio sp.]|uniref:glycosyltransferase family 4 protein n=1 Tax=Propionivibrio sp. TaxID=2212460 RepID=UPI003BF0A760